MANAVIVTLRFDYLDGQESFDVNAFTNWIEGTFDNADFDASYGFPECLEDGRPWVESIENQNR